MFLRMKRNPAVDKRIFAVVLAAGESRRFGKPKQLARVGGEPMVRIAAKLARTCFGRRSLLVVGHDGERVACAAGGGCEFLVVNDAFREGIGTSIACAASVLAPVADAIVLLLADQPLVEAAHVEKLVDAWSGHERHALLTAYADASGPPALLPRAVFDELRKLDGDRGAHAALERFDLQLDRLRFDAAGLDVDTAADLEAANQAAE